MPKQPFTTPVQPRGIATPASRVNFGHSPFEPSPAQEVQSQFTPSSPVGAPLPSRPEPIPAGTPYKRLKVETLREHPQYRLIVRDWAAGFATRDIALQYGYEGGFRFTQPTLDEHVEMMLAPVLAVGKAEGAALAHVKAGAEGSLDELEEASSAAERMRRELDNEMKWLMETARRGVGRTETVDEGGARAWVKLGVGILGRRADLHGLGSEAGEQASGRGPVIKGALPQGGMPMSLPSMGNGNTIQVVLGNAVSMPRSPLAEGGGRFGFSPMLPPAPTEPELELAQLAELRTRAAQNFGTTYNATVDAVEQGEFGEDLVDEAEPEGDDEPWGGGDL